jgi:type I restriction enzyme S subunit
VLGEVNFQSYTDKAAVPGVNRNHLHEEPMVLPPLELRQAFANSVAPLWVQHATNEKESRILASLRDMILPKLLSGMLKFQEAVSAL